MMKWDAFVLACILCLTPMTTAMARTHNVIGKVFVKVVVGIEKPLAEPQDIEEWIVHETSELGSPNLLELTDWTQMTESKQEIYSSTRGGRSVEARLVDSKQSTQFTVEITGSKLANVPLLITLPKHNGAKHLDKVTNYPGPSNIFTAFQVGQYYINSTSEIFPSKRRPK